LWLTLLLGTCLIRGRWRLKLAAVCLLGALISIVPTVEGVIARARVGLTNENDGLLQLESAIDRLLHGRPIYGVDWSGTPMAGYAWHLTPGGNPALHHLAYYPLAVLVGVPFRWLSDALGWRFDYRIVLIFFALVGMAAVLAIPAPPERRFMVICAVYVSPLISVFLWTGHNDIEFLAVLLGSLALLCRDRLAAAALVLGVAVALKPFAWPAVPFVALVMYLRWRRGRCSTAGAVLSLAALAAAPAASILPFVAANPRAFWTDVVLYVGGGIRDAYPISGYGFGEFLYQTHLIAHRWDSFPFPAFQVAAALPLLWFGARALVERQTLGRLVLSYTGLLSGVTFFARFFNDNYVAMIITLLLCVSPLAGVSLEAAEPAQAGRLAA
jgi:hypothetical protein